jgi:hypothetical protein
MGGASAGAWSAPNPRLTTAKFAVEMLFARLESDLEPTKLCSIIWTIDCRWRVTPCGHYWRRLRLSSFSSAHRGRLPSSARHPATPGAAPGAAAARPAKPVRRKTDASAASGRDRDAGPAGASRATTASRRRMASSAARSTDRPSNGAASARTRRIHPKAQPVFAELGCASDASVGKSSAQFREWDHYVLAEREPLAQAPVPGFHVGN